jgi:hypothetical protein
VRPRVRRSSNGAVKRATYIVDSRPRVLFTMSADGASKLIDAPAELYETAASGLATPDTFIVEPQLHDGDQLELEAIVTDYLEQVARYSRVPMTFSRLGDFLEALAE